MARRPRSRQSDSVPIVPPPVPKGVKTVVVFGGMFDPPHYYHTVGPLALTMRLYGETGWLLYVPGATSPLKPAGPVASDAHRVAMLKLALDIPGRRSIWTDEIERAAWQRRRGQQTPSYTVDTLTRLRGVIPKGVHLRLLIGSDQAAEFHRWKDCRRVLRLAEPIVMARDPVVTVNQLYQALDAEFWTRDERAAWCRRMAPNFPMPASSSTVRDRIPSAPKSPKRWEEDDDLSLITTPVAEYIARHRLYGFGSKQPTKPKGTRLDPTSQVIADTLGAAMKHAMSTADPKRFPRKAVTRLRPRRNR